MNRYRNIMLIFLTIVGLCLSCKLNDTSFSGKQKVSRTAKSSENNTQAEDYTKEDVPDSAITKGSFTVWTEPEDPAPYEDYNVIVQVKLDSGISSYSKSDLTGNLVGTDGYTQILGKYALFDSLKHYPSKGYARLTTSTVPGSYENVRDDITITSKILNETQTISIVF